MQRWLTNVVKCAISEATAGCHFHNAAFLSLRDSGFAHLYAWCSYEFLCVLECRSLRNAGGMEMNVYVCWRDGVAVLWVYFWLPIRKAAT